MPSSALKKKKLNILFIGCKYKTNIILKYIKLLTRVLVTHTIDMFTIFLSFHLFFYLNPPLFFFNDTATTEIYTLPLHDALPIFGGATPGRSATTSTRGRFVHHHQRSEEHTSELQSRVDLVCRLLLEKKKKN